MANKREALALLIFIVCLLTFGGASALTKQNSTAVTVSARADGTVEINDKPAGSLSDLVAVKDSLKQTFSERGESNTASESKQRTDDCQRWPVIIKADDSLNYGLVTDLIAAVRSAGANPLKIEAASDRNDPYVSTPMEPCPTNDLVKIKPNPLTLVVGISSDRKLTLNQDAMGTAEDTSPLRQRLRGLFQRRLEDKAFRSDTKEVEKTLFVKAARSLTFGEVKKIVSVVKEAGASPVGLQIDDLIFD